ncbi:MAG: hypothetical protein RIQ56_234 [Candidatus Parcubacteria bacterium]|jgi:succinyl-CoA synthetase alpha subunit
MKKQTLEQKVDTLASGLAELAVSVKKGFADINGRLADTNKRMGDGFADVNGKMEKGFARIEGLMEKGFAAVAEDIADMQEEMATKEQVISLHMQVNSIETELRQTRREKIRS